MDDNKISYNRNTLEEICHMIHPADQETMDRIDRVWDMKCMPLHSLGWLQDTWCRIGGIRRSVTPQIDRKLTIVMAADNGVIEEGVSQSGADITAKVVENMTKGLSAVVLMSEQAGSDVLVADIGMKYPVENVLDVHLMRGTKNMTKGPAMSRSCAVRAIEIGANLVLEKISQGYQMIALGEMGIGNTTTSTAILSVFSGTDPEEITGYGAGLSEEGWKKKVLAIKKAIEINAPDPKDPLDVLCKVGGLDIAGLAGVVLGAAAAGIPVMIDGYISAVAALVAVRLVPCAADALIAAHLSEEPGGRLALDMLKLKPLMHGGFHLGEGTGAVLAFSVLDQIQMIWYKMPSFSQMQIEAYEHLK